MPNPLEQVQDRQALATAGPIGQHLAGLHRLIPEVVQMETLVFEASMSSGSITQPANVAIPEQYEFELFGVSGYIQSPGDSVANFPLITWNVKEQSKRNVFGTDQTLAQHVNILGPLPPTFYPRTLYKFRGGANIVVTFAQASGWGGGTKRVGVCLLGSLVAPPNAPR